MIRSVLCGLGSGDDGTTPLGEAEHHDPRPLTPWLSRWDIDKKRRVHVKAMHPDGHTTEVIDARHWIESLHDPLRWPDGCVFELVVEVQNEND